MDDDSRNDSDGPVEPQGRDARIWMLAGALMDGAPWDSRLRVAFLGINPPECSVDDCTITLDDLPGGLVRAEVHVGLRPMTTGDWWSDASHGSGLGSYSDGHRDEALRRLGWTTEIGALQTFEVDPAHPASVGIVVDAIESVFGACASVPGAPPVPQVTWTVRREVAEPAPNEVEVPRDERWVEDATEQDLRDRLVQLAGQRGGRVVVRSTMGSSVELDLTARRRGDRIRVKGSGDPITWRASWTLPAGMPDAGEIHRDLRAALAPFEPEGQELTLSLRTEQHDEAAAWATDSVYVFVFGWLAGLAVVAGIGIVAGPAGAEGVLGILERGADGSAWDLVLLAAVAVTAALPAAGASLAAVELTERAGLGYMVSYWALFGAAAIATVAYLVVLVLAGSASGLVLMAPWIIGAVALAVPRVLQSLRRRRS